MRYIIIALAIIFAVVIHRPVPSHAQTVEDISSLRGKAEQGQARAQYELGIKYSFGTGGESQDYAEAVKWYRKAAEQGYAAAQASLGVLYAEGNGVPQDYVEAVKWYRLGAEQGDAEAQALLGFMYYQGRGVPKDDAEGMKWYRKAADQGDAGARAVLKTKGVVEEINAQPWSKVDTVDRAPSSVKSFSLWVFGVAAVVFAAFTFDASLKVRPAFQIRKRYNLVIACGFWFLAFRAVYDFWAAFAADGAIQFLFATVPAICCIAALVQKYRSKFLPLAGIYLVLLGVANTVFLLVLAFSGHGFAEGMGFLTSLPLRVLPSILLTKVLPIGLGTYFLLYWRQGQRATK